MKRLVQYAFILAVFFSIAAPLKAETVYKKSFTISQYLKKPLRTIKLDQFGLSLDIPISNRAIARNDGSVMIVDGEDYIKGRLPQRGFEFLSIEKSTDEYQYRHIQNEMAPNVYLAVDYGRYKPYPYLKVKTKKGMIKIEFNVDDLTYEDAPEHYTNTYANVIKNLKIH